MEGVISKKFKPLSLKRHTNNQYFPIFYTA
jgi:hypothetical protein